MENPLQAAPEPAAVDNLQTPPPEQTDKYKTWIIVLTLMTTIITANNANRDSQYYAVLASGEIQRQGLQGNYDMAIMTEYIRLSQESLVQEITVFGLENDPDAVASVELAARITRARADKLQTYSVFYTDARYAPNTADGLPNAEAYLTDALAKANELTKIQNHASDEYRRWDGKADSYVSVLTVMAMAFFLFGLAQALKGRMRLVFTIFGAVILSGSSLWAVLIVLI